MVLNGVAFNVVNTVAMSAGLYCGFSFNFTRAKYAFCYLNFSERERCTIRSGTCQLCMRRINRARIHGRCYDIVSVYPFATTEFTCLNFFFFFVHQLISSLVVFLCWTKSLSQLRRHPHTRYLNRTPCSIVHEFDENRTFDSWMFFAFVVAFGYANTEHTHTRTMCSYVEPFKFIITCGELQRKKKEEEI